MKAPRTRPITGRLLRGDSCTLELLLYGIARLLRRCLNAKLSRLQLNSAQCEALLQLNAHEGINQAGLAQLLDVTPISLVRLIDRLQSMGLIERQGDMSDRRAWLLSLTPVARQKVAQVHKLEVATCSEALAGLTSSEIEQVVRTLQVVRNNLLNRRPVPGTTKANEICAQQAK